MQQGKDIMKNVQLQNSQNPGDKDKCKDNQTWTVKLTMWSDLQCNSWPTFNWIQESAPFKEHFWSWNWSYQEIRTASIMVISYKALYKITWMMLSSKCQTQASCSPDKCIISQFKIAPSLILKTRVCAKPLIWIWFLYSSCKQN